MSSTTGKLSERLFHELKQEAHSLGFDLFSSAPLTIPSKDQEAYRHWVGSGLAGTMTYMSNSSEKRSFPEHLYPGLRTAIALGVSYYQGPFPAKPGPAYGRVARYAWGEDYHPLIVERLKQLTQRLLRMAGAARTEVAVDTKPLLERALAREAGLGFVGKNTVLIVPSSKQSLFHVGSYVFLAELLTDLEFDVTPIASPRAGCGGCIACLVSCPTGAFESAHRLDARRCISYLTIENKGEIPSALRASVGDWLFGCDVCQDVCPFNARAFETRWPEFRPERGVGPWVPLEEIFAVADQVAFQRKWGHTPLARAKRKGLLRNACVVAGNSGDRSLRPALELLLKEADTLIQDHARDALESLS